MSNRRQSTTRPRLDLLEDRCLLTGLVLQPDYFNMMLPGDAKSYPDAVVDVLANDDTPNLRIISYSQPALGTVEMVSGDAVGQQKLKYVAGPSFRGYDFFTYTAVNDKGEEASQSVYVKFDQFPDTFNPWSVQAPDVIKVTPGTATKLLDDNGNPLFALNYQGREKANAGVLLRFSPYVSLPAFGTLETEATRSDAQFYPQSFGNVWIYGSIDGVNALLAGLVYTPSASIDTTPEVSIAFDGYLYSELGLTVECQSKSTLILSTGSSVAPETGLNAPLAVNDDFSTVVNTSSVSLDVLMNDSARTASGRLELVSVQTIGDPHGLAWVDPSTNQIVYQPSAGFTGTDIYLYTVQNDNGLIAQALVKITVNPEMMFVVTTSVDRGTMIEVYNAMSGALMQEFKPFDNYSGSMMMETADMNGDGVAEIYAMQAGGESRMKVFDAFGNTMVDTVYRPFGTRRINGMDMEVGNIDSDKSAEMFFVASTSRGYELRVVDAATMQPQLTTVMRGMTGVPQVEFDQADDQLMIMGRTRGGGVVMAAMTSNESGRSNISRRTMVSDRDMRQMTRRNGPVTDLSLASIDQDGDGKMDDRMIQISFRNGLVHQMMLSQNGAVESSRTQQAAAFDPQVIMAALGLVMSPAGSIEWSDSVDPARRKNSRVVAVG